MQHLQRLLTSLLDNIHSGADGKDNDKVEACRGGTARAVEEAGPRKFRDGKNAPKPKAGWFAVSKGTDGDPSRTPFECDFPYQFNVVEKKLLMHQICRKD